MKPFQISLLHPFTPKAAGVVEASVRQYHSKPHRRSLELLAERGMFECSIEYFTHRFFGYQITDKAVNTRFYPVKLTLNGDHNKWKKQVSLACLKHYSRETPDVTIINMSGHAGVFCHMLASQIFQAGKKYVAMLGGQHYTDTEANRKYYREAHHLLVHTHLQKHEMLNMKMFKDLDIRIFPLGVDCTFFAPDKNEPNFEAINLLYIGRIVEWKRPHLAIEVVKKLKDLGKTAVLRLVGPTASQAYLNSLHELVKNYSLAEQIIFEGYKNHDEVRDILRSSDLLLLPSENETFGMVIVESMACGVPVAGVRGGHGPDEIIKNGFNGVLTGVENYVEDVVNFLNINNATRKIIRINARDTAVNDFNIENTYNVLRKSVEDCLLSSEL